MAAVTAVFDLFAPGDHVICSEDLYGGVTRLVNTIGKKNGLMVDFVNTGDLDEIKRCCVRKQRHFISRRPATR